MSTNVKSSGYIKIVLTALELLPAAFIILLIIIGVIIAPFNLHYPDKMIGLPIAMNIVFVLHVIYRKYFTWESFDWSHNPVLAISYCAEVIAILSFIYCVA